MRDFISFRCSPQSADMAFPAACIWMCGLQVVGESALLQIAKAAQFACELSHRRFQRFIFPFTYAMPFHHVPIASHSFAKEFCANGALVEFHMHSEMWLQLRLSLKSGVRQKKSSISIWQKKQFNFQMTYALWQSQHSYGRSSECTLKCFCSVHFKRNLRWQL